MSKLPRDKKTGRFVAVESDRKNRKKGTDSILYQDQIDQIKELNLARNKTIRKALDYCFENVPEIFDDSCRKTKPKSQKARPKTKVSDCED